MVYSWIFPFGKVGLRGILILSILLFSLSCAKTPKISMDIKGTGPLPAGIQDFLTQTSKMKTLKGFAEITVNFKGRIKKMDVAILAKAPNKLRIEFLDEFAGVVASVIATDESLVYSDSKGVSVFRGEDAERYFEKITFMPWNARELINVILGSLPKDVDATKNFFYDSDGRYWIAPYLSALYYEDDKLHYISTIKSRVQTEIVYSGLLKQGNHWYVPKIFIKLPRKNTALTILYNDVELNKNIPDKVFYVKGVQE